MTSSTGPASFGRVDDDGTVHVRTADGERAVGQIPDVSADEALAFYVRRYEALEVEVRLLVTRVGSGAISPEEARNSIKAVRTSVASANAVGDLDGLLVQLDGLAPVLEVQSEARRAERARQHEQTKAKKEQMVAEAALLDEWKALPRIDRATDDDLWHRFSAARTTYTRRRKAQFAEQAAKRDTAKEAKERIIAEARALATSTDWGPTAGEFRDLMTRWKAVGPAPREVDDALWAEFRGLQDQFFAARQSVFTEQDAEFKGNLTAKEELLTQAEATLLPVTDLAAAKAAFRSFLEKYNAIGKVPREQIRALDGRVKALETAVRRAEEDEWRRSDPEARTRAEETVAMLSAEIDKLTEKIAKAEARGDRQAAGKAKDSIATYQTWLDQARQTLTEFTG
jgi:hypothetical protein